MQMAAAARQARIVLNSPVRRIDAGPRRRDASSPTRSTVKAKRVIVAIPPTLAGRIDYDAAAAVPARPAHPAPPQGTLTRSPPSTTSRSGATRASPARRSRPTGLVSATFDDSPQDGTPGRDLRLRRRRRGARVRRACRRSERREQVLDEFADVLRRRGAQPDATSSRRTGRRAVDAAAARSASPAPGTLLAYGDRAARARRPHPLGRHRDLDLLERLHGRRRALRRARRRRRCWTSCEARARRSRCARSPRRSLPPPAAAAPRASAGTRASLALVPPPGLPGARLRRARTAASTRAPTTTRRGDTVPLAGLRVLGATGTLLRSWTIQRPGPRAGRTASRSRPATPGAASSCSTRRRRGSLLLDPRDRRADARTRPSLDLPALSPTQTPDAQLRAPGARTAASTSPTTSRPVIWRVPPGGGAPEVWLADPQLDGGQFGTTGIALAADHRTLLIGQQSAAGARRRQPGDRAASTRSPIGADGKPGPLDAALGEPARRRPRRLRDREVRPRSTSRSSARSPTRSPSSAPTAEERFPSRSPAQRPRCRSTRPPASRSSARSLIVANQSYVNGDASHQAILDVDVGEPRDPRADSRQEGQAAHAKEEGETPQARTGHRRKRAARAERAARARGRPPIVPRAPPRPSRTSVPSSRPGPLTRTRPFASPAPSAQRPLTAHGRACSGSAAAPGGRCPPARRSRRAARRRAGSRSRRRGPAAPRRARRSPTRAPPRRRGRARRRAGRRAERRSARAARSGTARPRSSCPARVADGSPSTKRRSARRRAARDVAVELVVAGARARSRRCACGSSRASSRPFSSGVRRSSRPSRISAGTSGSGAVDGGEIPSASGHSRQSCAIELLATVACVNGYSAASPSVEPLLQQRRAVGERRRQRVGQRACPGSSSRR